MHPADELRAEQDYRDCDPLNLDGAPQEPPPQAKVLVWLDGYASDRTLRFTIDAEYGEDRATVTRRAQTETDRRLWAHDRTNYYRARIGSIDLPRRPVSLSPAAVAYYREAFKGDNS